MAGERARPTGETERRYYYGDYARTNGETKHRGAKKLPFSSFKTWELSCCQLLLLAPRTRANTQVCSEPRFLFLSPFPSYYHDESLCRPYHTLYGDRPPKPNGIADLLYF